MLKICCVCNCWKQRVRNCTNNYGILVILGAWDVFVSLFLATVLGTLLTDRAKHCTTSFFFFFSCFLPYGTLHAPPPHFPDPSPCNESCFTFVTVWEGPPDGANDQRMKGTHSVCLWEQRCNYAPI